MQVNHELLEGSKAILFTGHALAKLWTALEEKKDLRGLGHFDLWLGKDFHRSIAHPGRSFFGIRGHTSVSIASKAGIKKMDFKGSTV